MVPADVREIDYSALDHLQALDRFALSNDDRSGAILAQRRTADQLSSDLQANPVEDRKPLKEIRLRASRQQLGIQNVSARIGTCAFLAHRSCSTTAIRPLAYPYVKFESHFACWFRCRGSKGSAFHEDRNCRQ
jgi:hypothetical protein